MKRSCSYCGRYHDTSFDCGRKPSRTKNLTKVDKFRSNRTWRNKSIEIRERDKGLCQICIRQLYNTTKQYNFETIEVHHIVPLAADMTRSLDDFNLISLCKYHHAMAEDYDIPQDELHKIAQEQERKR